VSKLIHQLLDFAIISVGRPFKVGIHHNGRHPFSPEMNDLGLPKSNLRDLQQGKEVRESDYAKRGGFIQQG